MTVATCFAVSAASGRGSGLRHGVLAKGGMTGQTVTVLISGAGGRAAQDANPVPIKAASIAGR
jgi:hypothetical protein